MEIKLLHSNEALVSVDKVEKSELPAFSDPANNHKTAVEALRLACGVLDAQNVDYTICDGTLLGMARNGDFIPGDNDIDLRISGTRLSDDATAALHSAGLSKFREVHFLNSGLRNYGFFFKDVPIDIYSSIVSEGWETRNLRFKEGVLTYNVPYYGRQQTQFFGVNTWQPRNAEAVLELCYGPGWRQPDADWDHLFSFGGINSITGNSRILTAALRRWLSANGHPLPSRKSKPEPNQ